MKKIAGFALAVAICVAGFARGPVGPASVAMIEVDGLLRETAAWVSGPRPIDPGRVPLAAGIEAKRLLKRALGAAGMVEQVEEGGWQYLLGGPGADRPVHVLLRFRGDQLLAVAIEHSGQPPAPGLVQAIRARFPDYAVSVIPPSGG